MIAVSCSLRCHVCGTTVQRTLTLPEGIAPPCEYTCAKCTGSASGFDALAADELTGFTRPDGRLEDSASRAMKQKRARDWDKRNPSLYRARQMFRRDRWPSPPNVGKAQRGKYVLGLLSRLTERAESLSWHCAYCNCRLTWKRSASRAPNQAQCPPASHVRGLAPQETAGVSPHDASHDL